MLACLSNDIFVLTRGYRRDRCYLANAIYFSNIVVLDSCDFYMALTEKCI